MTIRFCPNSFDRVYSISVIEHLLDDEIEDVRKRAYEWLKPGGFFVLTIDLFLNVKPFGNEIKNEYGKNISVKNLIEIAPFKLFFGEPTELYGFETFDRQKIQDNLAQYYQGLYPALAQCIVLQKPE